MSKPIFCCDFDGVLHSYTSGWEGADVISDPPVPGAMAFLVKMAEFTRVYVYSARSHQEGGIQAMKRWIAHHMIAEHALGEQGDDLVWGWVENELQWPTFKPSALVTLDDRAIRFNGTFPAPTEIVNFKPWNKGS